MTSKTSTLSFADLNLRKASEEPHEFEFIDANGEGSGFFLSVIGAHCDAIMRAGQELEDARRRKSALQAIKAAKARPDHVEITPVAEDIDQGTRMIAKRIVGWRGIDVPYSPEKALELVQMNPLVSVQVMEASNDEARFTKPSSTAS